MKNAKFKTCLNENELHIYHYLLRLLKKKNGRKWVLTRKFILTFDFHFHFHFHFDFDFRSRVRQSARRPLDCVKVKMKMKTRKEVTPYAKVRRRENGVSRAVHRGVSRGHG